MAPGLMAELMLGGGSRILMSLAKVHVECEGLESDLNMSGGRYHH